MTLPSHNRVTFVAGTLAALLFGYFAVPRILGSERIAAEADAMYHIGAIATAVNTYRSQYPRHPVTLPALSAGGAQKCGTPNADHACLIEPKLASGHSDGFHYVLQATDGGEVVWAIPERPGSPSGIAFCLPPDGYIRSGVADQLSTSTRSELNCGSLQRLP
jgi:hypothetical protein